MIKQIVIFIAIAQAALAFPQDVVEKIMEEPMDEMDSDPIVKGREPRIDTNCEGILTPMNPDCCFMTDPDHERTKPFGQPLENSPYKINLVAVEKKQLNKFEKSTFNNSDMWTLTPLMDQAQNNVEEELMEGGPIRLQLYNDITKEGFDQFWVQAKKFVAPDSWHLAGDFIEIPNIAVYPNMTMHDGMRKVGCDKEVDNNNVKATIVSHRLFDYERYGVELAWNPPQRCTDEQIESGETMKCRTKDSIYFFTYTMGDTATGKFWIGQNSFGFYVDHEYDQSN